VSTTATPASALDAPRGDLVLRVCGSSRHGQIVRLRSTKCTIGSGPRSTLRLRARGVRPIHCLIVRGSSSTVIRRWSPDTRLNGRGFADAELADGDRLGIGTIELEVLDPGRLCSSNPAETRQAPPQDPPSLQIPGRCQLGVQGVDRLTARLTLANRQGRQRARRLLERLRSANREVEQLRQTTQQGERLHADQAALEAQREDLEPPRRQSEHDHAGFALPPRKEEPPVDSEESRQAEPREAPRNAPIDIAEVFRRMHAGGSSSEGRKPSAEAEPRPSNSPPESQPSPPPRSANEGEEESIEKYMARLLDRVYAVRGDVQRQEREPHEIQREPPVEPAPQELTEPHPAERPAVPQAVARPRQPKKMTPRAVAPERQVNLSAMRELANLSAHSAIDRHARRQVRVAAWGKVLTTTVGVGAGAVLLRIWWTNQASELTFYAALVSLLVALLWGLQCARLTGRKMVHKSRPPVGQSGEDHHDAGLNAAAQKEEALGQDALSGDESDPPIEDSDRAWEQELKSLIDAWPRR